MARRIGMLLVCMMLVVLTFSIPADGVGVTTVNAGGYCDWVQFVADVTIPDGVPVDPGFVFRKTWRVKNIGTCTWNRSYKVVFVGGEQMGGVSAMNLPREVAPGQTIDLTISMTAPLTPGLYRGFWELQNPAGALFGMSQAANRPFFVEINVRSTAAPVYDFVAQAPAANWRNEVTGKVYYPGIYGDPYGFVIPVERPILENGIPSTGNGILMAPPVEFHEHIYGIFPPYTVKQGDRFQAMVGCEYGARDCDVIFVLQYNEPGYGTRSFWNGWKSYKNTFSRVNLSLGPLAGKTVSFILLIRPNGDGIGDHAIWANPVIVNSFEPGPSVATVTPPPLTEVPTPISTLPSRYTGCDRATFMTDVTVPDGTVFSPGEAFTKTWRFRNTGRCTWTTDYSVVFSSGDQMGAATPINLPTSVAPNQTIDLSLNLTAPNAAGNYRGYFFFKNASGNLFGIGLQGNRPFWLAMSVPNTLPPTTANGYDFVAHACEAQWSSGGGALQCPDTTAANGTIGIVNNPRLENNTVDSRPGLLTMPNNVYNGYIQGVFPPFAVQQGDHFKTIVNCEYAQRSCYVVFRLDYQVDNGPVQNLWAFGERYDGLYYQADVDLSPLAGKNVKFILGANANGSPFGDRAIWVAPSIVRSGGPVVFPSPTSTMTATLPPTFTPTLTLVPSATATATPVPTFTATVPPVNTGPLTYTNQTFGFQFNYPANAVLTISQDNFAHFNLPFAPGTNLSEKYLDVSVFDSVSSCVSPLGRGNPMVTSETVTTANGLQFLKETGQDGAVGQFYDWIAYSIPKGTSCISLNFVMHSTNPDNYPVPPPLYNRDAESAVLSDMISSFNWTAP